ncbi:MAG: hypothetical protein KatS3mg102_2707 [Planctomycetota bacterium]|nr:MAG: hypothetical protein KatS3mg102_2707 [Planctomycetota bacterium]
MLAGGAAQGGERAQPRAQAQLGKRRQQHLELAARGEQPQVLGLRVELHLEAGLRHQHAGELRARGEVLAGGERERGQPPRAWRPQHQRGRILFQFRHPAFQLAQLAPARRQFELAARRLQLRLRGGLLALLPRLLQPALQRAGALGVAVLDRQAELAPRLLEMGLRQCDRPPRALQHDLPRLGRQLRALVHALQLRQLLALLVQPPLVLGEPQLGGAQHVRPFQLGERALLALGLLERQRGALQPQARLQLLQPALLGEQLQLAALVLELGARRLQLAREPLLFELHQHRAGAHLALALHHALDHQRSVPGPQPHPHRHRLAGGEPAGPLTDQHQLARAHHVGGGGRGSGRLGRRRRRRGRQRCQRGNARRAPRGPEHTAPQCTHRKAHRIILRARDAPVHGFRPARPRGIIGSGTGRGAMARATPERGGPQTGGGAERSRSTEPHGAGSGGLRARLRASSLWWKVSAGFLFAAALPVGVFALVQHRTVSGLRLAQARAELEHDTEQLADRIEQALAGASELAAALARNPDVVALGCGHAAASSGPAARAQALLQTVVAAGRLYAGAALTGGAGRIVVATDPELLGAAVAQAFGLPAHPTPCRGIHLGEDRRGGRLVVVCAPVAAGGAGQAAAGGAGQVLLLLAAPRLFAEVGEHPNDDRSFAVLGGAGAPLWGTVAPPQAEVERVVVPLGAVPWAVTGMVPRAVLLAPLRAQAWRTLGVAAAVALAIGAAGALLAWGVTRRLSALEQAARIAARGQLEVEIDPGPPDEIGRLAAAWQRTLAELGRAQRELAATEAALRRHAEELEQRVAERTRELAERGAARRGAGAGGARAGRRAAPGQRGPAAGRDRRRGAGDRARPGLFGGRAAPGAAAGGGSGHRAAATGRCPGTARRGQRFDQRAGVPRAAGRGARGAVARGGAPGGPRPDAPVRHRLGHERADRGAGRGDRHHRGLRRGVARVRRAGADAAGGDRARGGGWRSSARA